MRALTSLPSFSSFDVVMIASGKHNWNECENSSVQNSREEFGIASGLGTVESAQTVGKDVKNS